MSQIFVWTFSDAMGLVVFGTLIIVALFISAMNFVEQRLCKHDRGVNENRACDAVCRKCGKNLGFIGTWREQHKGQQS